VEKDCGSGKRNLMVRINKPEEEDEEEDCLSKEVVWKNEIKIYFYEVYISIK